MSSARLLVAALVATMWACSPAYAGTFTVISCGYAMGGSDDAWQYRATDSGAYIASPPPNCMSVPADRWSGLVVWDVLGSVGPLHGPNGEFVLRSSAGATITGATVWRFLHRVSDPGWRPYIRTSAGDVEVCGRRGDCTIGAFTGGDEVLTGAFPASELRVGIECYVPEVPDGGCSSGGSSGLDVHLASATIYRSRVTINDPTPPALGAITSALFPTDPQQQSPWLPPTTTTVTAASATDVTGLTSVAVVADGSTTLATSAYSCDYSNASPDGAGRMVVDPCPHPAGPIPLTINTASLPDGEHTLQFRAIDATATNTKLSPPRTIRVDRTPPAAPQNLTGAASSTATAARTVAVQWTVPPGQVAPIVKARWRVCPAGIATDCTSGTTVATTSLDGIPLPGDGTYDVSVVLEDAAGNFDESTRTSTAVAPGPGARPSIPPLASPVPTTPAPPSPSTSSNGGVSPGLVVRSPGLRVTSVRPVRTAGRVWRVGLRLVGAPGGRVGVLVETADGHVAQRTLTMRGRTGRVLFSLRRGDRITRAIATIAAQSGYRRERVTRRVSR